jgi:Uma2 family endonuclease
MTVDTRLFTADELLRLPEDGSRYELVEGELKKMSPLWKRLVQVHRSSGTETIATTVADVLEVDEVVPGWRLPLDDIYSA